MPIPEAATYGTSASKVIAGQNRRTMLTHWNPQTMEICATWGPYRTWTRRRDIDCISMDSFLGCASGDAGNGECAMPTDGPAIKQQAERPYSYGPHRAAILPGNTGPNAVSPRLAVPEGGSLSPRSVGPDRAVRHRRPYPVARCRRRWP